MQMNNKKNKKGFTLIEIIVYVALMGTVIVSFISFVLAANQLKNKAYVVSEVNANLRIAADLISRKIRAAQSVVSPSVGNSAAALSLDMPGTDPNINFFLNQGVIYLEEVGVATTSLTSLDVNIKNLIFDNYGTNNSLSNIHFEIEAEYRNKASNEFKYENNLETSVNTKN